MSDDKSPETSHNDSDSSPKRVATPIGNQNLIIGLVLGAVILLLFLIVVQMSGRPRGGSSEIEDLKSELTSTRQRVNEERSLLGLPPLGSASGDTIEALAVRISADSTKLAGMVSQLHNALADREARLATADATRQALTKQITDLQSQLDQARLAAGDTARLQVKLNDTQTLLEASNRQLQTLREQLNTAPSQSELASLTQRLDDALAARDNYEKQVNELTRQLQGMVDGGELDSLKQKLSMLEPENNRLRYELQKIQAELDKTRLFAEKVDDLPVAAQALYVELSKLENATPAELQAEYARISQQLRADVVDTISFQTGSSRINLDKVEEIRRTVQSKDDGSYFLVVGYASQSGNLATNKQLSSDRATTIASVVNIEKKETQGVQAVFLSQTDRFSPTDLIKNQICEIWEIKK